MKKIFAQLIGMLGACLLAGCAGIPANVGTRSEGAVPTGTERTISAEACGFQLLLFIPINVNNRVQTAYKELEEAAGGDFITDVQVYEHWKYAFVGTIYCTGFQAKAIRAKTS